MKVSLRSSPRPMAKKPAVFINRDPAGASVLGSIFN